MTGHVRTTTLAGALASAALAALLVAQSLGGAALAAGLSFDLSPDHGRPGDKVTATGDGFGKSGKIILTWDGKDLAADAFSDGAFKVGFDVPTGAKPGKHNVHACASDIGGCDMGEADATFVVDPKPTPKPTKTPKPTAKPTQGGQPNATPVSTAKATATPTKRPRATATPRVSHLQPPAIALGPLTALPWAPNGSGPCDNVPFRPSDVEEFARPSVFSNGGAGTRLQPSVATRSGTWAFSSVYDDFGSAGRPIRFSFPYYAPRKAAVFVGREASGASAGPVTAVLSGIGFDASGTLVELARAQRTLEAGAVPITRCLAVIAPAGRSFAAITIDYVDDAGDSVYERRWVDDVSLADYATVTAAERPTIRILTPADGSTLHQLASVGTTVRARVEGSRSRPYFEVLLNDQLVGTPPHVGPAPGADPFAWDVTLVIREGLLQDADNAIDMRLGGSSTTARASNHFRVVPPVDGDLRAVDMEINQAVQEPSNLVPLIGDKRTVVRVFVAARPDTRGPWGWVTGDLVARRADGTSHTYHPLGRTVPTAARPDRYTLDSQLLFVLDRADTHAGSLQLTATVRPADGRPQLDPVNDTISRVVRFLEPLHYTAYGLLTSFPDGTTNDWSKLESFTRYVENVFPVSSAQVLPVPRIGTVPQMVRDVDGLRGLAGSLQGRLPPDVSIFGLWAGDDFVRSLCNREGMCQTGFASWRRTDGIGHPALGPTTMAQELSHAEGLWWHAETPGEPAAAPFPFFNPEWPWYHTSIGHVGLDTRDPVSPQIIPPYWTDSEGHWQHAHDYMSYAGGMIWVSPYTYCDLLDHFTRGEDRCTDAVKTAPSMPRAVADAPRTSGALTSVTLAVAPAQPAAVATQGDAQLTENTFLYVRGHVAPDGKSATIEPLDVIRRTGELPFLANGDAFVIEVLDAKDHALFTAPFTPQDTHVEVDQSRPYAFWIPLVGDARRVVIWRGKRLIASREASAHSPTLELSTPLGGTTLTAPTALGWQAGDADGDALTYAVELSTDGGMHWLPVAVDLQEPTLLLDPAQLPGATEAVLRVQTSDGFRDAAVMSDPFTIPAHAPAVAISDPAAATTIEAGAPLVLQSSAFDWDGELADEAYAWASDLDGDLGSGPWLTTSTLSQGDHVITLTVTDADGKAASASVAVTVSAAGDVSTLPVPPQPVGCPDPTPPAPASQTGSPEADPSAGPSASPAVSAPPPQVLPLGTCD